MKNLVLSTACSIDPNLIKFFLKTLRKYFKDDIHFLVGKSDYKVKGLLNHFNSKYTEINEHKFDVQTKRYHHYLKILEKNNYDKILICDSRDIYFQSDPFQFNYEGEINFFLEGQKIIDCEHNSNWFLKAYGKDLFDRFSQKIICCSGTTLGNYRGMMNYLKLMIKNSQKYKYKKRLKYLITFRRDKAGRGVDQAHANYIAHNNLLDKSQMYENETGPIATVYHLKKIRFNEKSQLINELNKPYAVVHQYDKRWSEFSENIQLIKKNLKIA